MKSLAALFFAFAALCARAAAPTEVSAEYKVYINGFFGARVLESYSRKGDAYSIESRSTSEGALKVFRDETLTYTSAGKVGARELQTIVFESQTSFADGTRPTGRRA